MSAERAQVVSIRQTDDAARDFGGDASLAALWEQGWRVEAWFHEDELNQETGQRRTVMHLVMRPPAKATHAIELDDLRAKVTASALWAETTGRVVRRMELAVVIALGVLTGQLAVIGWFAWTGS